MFFEFVYNSISDKQIHVVLRYPTVSLNHNGGPVANCVQQIEVAFEEKDSLKNKNLLGWKPGCNLIYRKNELNLLISIGQSMGRLLM